ncbi:hypothetical protein MLD38_005129 [Melastoma candidum]|uniref:Uncharacterized protein n=1 Tax=Melastoma candidum TaxID=119954 RepID=A0ACB9S739_9MYRT|nr:hypothetical protein MLD38_005129 [Melastoma candidum]
MEAANMVAKSYQTRAESLLRQYLPADSFVPYTSVIVGILGCKMVYDLSQLISALNFKSYSSLSNMKRVEWNNRAMSTVHAIFITAMSLYLVFWSGFFGDDRTGGLPVFRSSSLSSSALGISLGYFLTDLAMIFWLYPSLGGFEYVIHHLLSMSALLYAILMKEGQLYTFMVLISECTTPGINLRWYLDTAGKKRSKAYVINGVLMFFAWLGARILLFVYLFYHLFMHLDQIEQITTYGKCLLFMVPCVLSVMNTMWFMKIIKGLVKTLAKRQ